MKSEEPRLAFVIRPEKILADGRLEWLVDWYRVRGVGEGEVREHVLVDAIALAADAGPDELLEAIANALESWIRPTYQTGSEELPRGLESIIGIEIDERELARRRGQ